MGSDPIVSPVVYERKTVHAVGDFDKWLRSSLRSHEDIALERHVRHALDAGEAGVLPAAVAFPREDNAVVPEREPRAEAQIGEIAKRIDELAVFHKDVGYEAAVQALRLHLLRTAKPRHKVRTK